MFADDNFSVLCPDVNMAEWCLSPPSNGTCCGICPSSLSGLGGHISLAFSSLSSIAAIALSPSSAPSSLVTNLIQADAYAVSLLGYLLSDSSGLDYFHAAYALLLALSSLIPLTALTFNRSLALFLRPVPLFPFLLLLHAPLYLVPSVGNTAASPPWAVTGQKSPAEREADLQNTIAEVFKQMDSGSDSSSSDSEGGEKRSLRRRRHRKASRHERKLRKLERVLRENPQFLEEDGGGGGGSHPFCGIPSSHWMLYIGFSLSVLLWGASLYLGILGALSGTSKVALAQPNCLDGLGNSAVYMLYANIGFMILAIVVFIATILNHLMHDVANALQREVTTEYSGSTRLVFGVSFIVWLVWMVTSFGIYYMAGNANLLAASEFSWSFGSTFSALMLIVPIYSVIKGLIAYGKSN
ncbi:hypothetical protein JCM8547_000440 [Rhodosporidiobolus lusitaniae]